MSLTFEITNPLPAIERIGLIGSLDQETYEDFERRLLPLVPASEFISLDLSQLTHVDIHGLRSLLSVKEAATAENAIWKLENVPPSIESELRITDFLSESTLLDDLDKHEKELAQILSSAQHNLGHSWHEVMHTFQEDLHRKINYGDVPGDEVQDFKQTCFFCLKLKEPTNYDLFYKYYPTLRQYGSCLMETDFFRVETDLGPIAPYHIIVIPKKHIVSYAHLPDEVLADFEACMSSTQKKLKVHNFVELEHGTGFFHGQELGCGNTIFHAHWHIVPIFDKNLPTAHSVAAKIVQDLQGLEFIHFPHESYSRTFKHMHDTIGGVPYLMLKQGDDVFIFLNRAGRQIPPQILRRLTAIFIYGKNTFWNWKHASPMDIERSRRRIENTIRLFKGSAP